MGVNDSMVHEDLMIGCADMHIDAGGWERTCRPSSPKGVWGGFPL